MNSGTLLAGATLFELSPLHVDEGERIGFLHEDKAAALGRLMAVDGQRDPIKVTANPADPDKPWRLVTGMHRLIGARMEGLTVWAIEVSGNPEDLAELEASENLHRRPLAPLERAKFTAALVAAAQERIARQHGNLSHQQLGIKKRWDAVRAGEVRPEQALKDEADDTQGSSDQLNNIQGNSWALHSALALGDRLRLIRNAGVGGNTTAQMAARFAADVLAYLPAGGLVGILGGTNDTDGVSDSLANIEAMIVAARAAGCNVFLATPPPQGVAALATPAAPTLAAATTGGTLASATYSYKIAALNAVGTTLASANATVAVTGPTGSVKITWPQVQGASQYKIYGRTAGSELLIATITPSSTGLVFVDTGSVTPAGALPGSNTTAIARDTTKHLKLGRARLSIQKLARKYGLVVLDFYTLLTDPASGLYQTGYTEDGVHPTTKVHRLMGVYAQTVLGPLLKTGNNVIWPADNANPAGLTGNALLQNTASGRPTGWVSFGGAVTETMTTDAAIAGATFQVAATDYSLHVIESPTYAVNAGDTIAFMGKVSIAGADAGFSAVSIGAKWSGGTYLSRINITADTNGVVPFYFEGIAPAGTTNVKLELATNLGPVTVKIGQVEFLNLTALGLA